MYLVARQESQAQELILKLYDNGISAVWLPLMGIQLNNEALSLLKSQIQASSLIMVTAPAIVDYLAEIQQLTGGNHTFITMGKATALRLSKIMSTPIVYPQYGSGITALESNQVLEPYLGSHLLVMGGDKINPKLEHLLKKLQISHDYISLYQRRNIGIENLDIIEKLISNREIAGIIITSRQIAAYLVECMNLLQMGAKVRQLLVISIHSQISDYLHSNGFVNIQQTINSDNDSILKLIRNIADERSTKY